MRITSQMLAANQLKAGIEPSSKTLLDYIPLEKGAVTATVIQLRPIFSLARMP